MTNYNHNQFIFCSTVSSNDISGCSWYSCLLISLFPLGDPDRELQSKQRIWELLQPHLEVDSRGVANYKGSRFEVKGKGLCRAKTLTNCGIR